MVLRRISIILALCLLFSVSAQAVTYTWIGSADGNWSNTANWVGATLPVDREPDVSVNTSGLSMPYTDSIIFNGTNMPSSNIPSIGGNAVSGSDTPPLILNSGGAITFAVEGRESAVWCNSGVVTNTVFAVGDGVGGGGTNDVSLTVTGLGTIGRHNNGTRHFVVNSDGTFTIDGNADFASSAVRLCTMTIAGGDIIINGTITDLTNYAGCFIEFTALGGSFTARHTGGNFPNFAAVTNAGANAWINNAGGNLEFTDNGNNTFTVSVMGDSILWTGATDGNWDTLTTNWDDGGAVLYTNGAFVEFGDTGGTNYAISVVSDVTPSSVIFSDTGVGTNVYTFDTSAINGVGSVTLASGFGGSVQLNATNGYTGGTKLSDGTLIVGNAGALGAGTLTLAGGTYKSSVGVANSVIVTDDSTLIATGDTSLNGSISGTGTMNFGGTNNGQADATFTLGTNTLNGFTGTVSHDNAVGLNSLYINSVNTAAKFETSGTSTNAGSKSLRFLGDSTIGELSGTGGRIEGDNATLTVNQDSSSIFSGVLADAVASSQVLNFVKSGSGTLRLTTDGTYSGSTTIKAGTLVAGVDNGVQGIGPASAILLGDTSGTADSTLRLGLSDTITYDNTNITVQSGNSGVASIIASGIISLSQAVITLGSDGQAGKGVTLTGGGTASWTFRFWGVIQDNPTMTPGTAGTVTIGATHNVRMEFRAANTYAGDTRAGGTTVSQLVLINALALQNSTLDMQDATGSKVTFSQDSTVGGIKGLRDLDMNGKILSIGNNDQSTSYSGQLTNGALTKIGSGTLTLSGTNAYDGATTVQSGELIINGNHTGATNATTVASGSAVGGGGTLGGDLTLASGANFVFSTTNTLTVAGTVALDNSFSVASLVTESGGAIDWASIPSATYTLINTSSDLSNINFNSVDGVRLKADGSSLKADVLARGTFIMIQ